MRDKTHAEQIIRWSNYIKNTPRSVWKPRLNDFINAQFEIADKLRGKLKQTEKGRRILQDLKNARINKH